MKLLSIKSGILMCTVVGGLLLANGLWIPAKAQLAQVLLELAWQRTRVGEPDARPWPWADTAPLARLVIAGERFIVLRDSGGESLAFGPSHVTGSALPGTAGTSVIAAHRDTQFTVLAEVEVGDEFTLETADGEERLYIIRGIEVLPSPTITIPTGTNERLILSTCWPIGAGNPNPQERLVVIAEPAAG